MRVGSVSTVTLSPLSSVTVTGNVAPAGSASVAAVVDTGAEVMVVCSALTEVSELAAPASPEPQPAKASEPASKIAMSRVTSRRVVGTTGRRLQGSERCPVAVRHGVRCPFMRTPFDSTHHMGMARKMVGAGWLLPGRTTPWSNRVGAPLHRSGVRFLRGKRLLLLYSRYLTPGTTRSIS